MTDTTMTNLYTTMTSEEIRNAFAETGVIVELNISVPQFKKQDKKARDHVAGFYSADKDTCKVVKSLIGVNPVHKEMTVKASAIRREFNARTLDMGQRGRRYVPANEFENLEAVMNLMKGELTALSNKFRESWEDVKVKAALQLGQLSETLPASPPEVTVEFTTIPIDTGAGFLNCRAMPAPVAKALATNLSDRVTEQAQAAKESLYQEVLALAMRGKAGFDRGPDGKRNRFSYTLLAGMENAWHLGVGCNWFGDLGLAGCGLLIREILDLGTVKEIRKSERLLRRAWVLCDQVVTRLNPVAPEILDEAEEAAALGDTPLTEGDKRTMDEAAEMQEKVAFFNF